jgi:hypothetical protein
MARLSSLLSKTLRIRQSQVQAAHHSDYTPKERDMPLLTIVNQTPGPLALQDPTGYTQFSVTVPGAGTSPPIPISLDQLAHLEPLLEKEATFGRIAWSIAANPEAAEDNLPQDVRTVLVSPDTIGSNDRNIVTHLTAPGPVSEQFMASLPVGSVVTILDGKGDAATNNINVSVAGGGTIDGAASHVISTNLGHATYLKIAANAWRIIGLAQGRIIVP